MNRLRGTEAGHSSGDPPFTPQLRAVIDCFVMWLDLNSQRDKTYCSILLMPSSGKVHRPGVGNEPPDLSCDRLLLPNRIGNWHCHGQQDSLMCWI